VSLFLDQLLFVNYNEPSAKEGDAYGSPRRLPGDKSCLEKIGTRRDGGTRPAQTDL
jgi:hypothetical protein